jgi:hypothetical protein
MIFPYGSGIRRTQRIGVIALALMVVGLLAVAWGDAAWAAGPGTSGCVACHTDAAKLKALTPPDPPPTEEGEG